MIIRSMKRPLSRYVQRKKKNYKIDKKGKKIGEKKQNSISRSRLIPQNQTVSSTATRKSSNASIESTIGPSVVHSAVHGRSFRNWNNIRASAERPPKRMSEGGGRQFPSKRARFSVVHGVQRVRLRTSYVGSALNFPRARALSSGRK